MKTLYEVNWHSKNDKFTHITVTPITVLWEGIREGCSAPSITANDASNNTFFGSADNFFESEVEAWAHAKQDLAATLSANEQVIRELEAENVTIRDYLSTL
jgi:hypothetical protein